MEEAVVLFKTPRHANFELLKVLDKCDFKVTFFIDTCFLNRLKYEKTNHSELMPEYNSIINKLRLLSERGHEIQLHLHPNWYNAIYKDGEWKSIFKRVSIQRMQKGRKVYGKQ